MSTASLRPPQPVYKILAFVTLGIILFWAGPWVLGKVYLNGVQSHYLRDYIKASVATFGHKPRERVLLVVQPKLHAVTQDMSNVEYKEWLQENVYGGLPLLQFLRVPLIVTGFLWMPLFAAAAEWDQRKRAQFRDEARHIRGTRLVLRAEFTREVKGDGIGWRTEEFKSQDVTVGRSFEEKLKGDQFPYIRIPKWREPEHLAVCGNTGSGKTSVLMSITDQAEQDGSTCIIYDPHRQFLKRYFNKDRGDIILHSIDDRMPHWNPTHEVDYTTLETARMTSLAAAESLYPGHPGQKDWFFTDCARRMYQHCMVHYRPNAEQLVHLYEHMDPLIDAIAKGTDLETMLTKNAGPQRAGAMATASQCLPALRQIPPESPDRPIWAAREYAKHRKGWIFLTAMTDTRVAMRPLHSLWLDSLIMRLIDLGERAGLPRVYVVIDELQALQYLPRLGDLFRETRKSDVCAAIGFHAKSDLKRIYSEEADTIISAPATKFMLRIGDSEAQEWATKICGDHEIERLKETIDNRSKRSYTSERSIERLIMATEFADFEPRVGVLRYGAFATKVKIRYVEPRPDRAEGFIQAPGKPAVLLPMPTLEEVLKKEEEERLRKAQELAFKMSAGSGEDQPGGKPKRRVPGPKIGREEKQ